MNKILFTVFFISIFLENILPQVPPEQGDVVFNTIDPFYNAKQNEYFVIVNRTSKVIDLSGYEVQTFAWMMIPHIHILGGILKVYCLHFHFG